MTDEQIERERDKRERERDKILSDILARVKHIEDSYVTQAEHRPTAQIVRWVVVAIIGGFVGLMFKLIAGVQVAKAAVAVLFKIGGGNG